MSLLETRGVEVRQPYKGHLQGTGLLSLRWRITPARTIVAKSVRQFHVEDFQVFTGIQRPEVQSITARGAYAACQQGIQLLQDHSEDCLDQIT